MGKFEEIKLGWGGRTYVIPPNKVMGAIARVEDHVTMIELQRYTQQHETLPLAKIAQAFASVLTYAGAENARAEDIYASMFGTQDAQQDAAKAVMVLLAMMRPPDMMNGKGPATPGKSRPAAAKSSRKRSRQRSSSTAG